MSRYQYYLVCYDIENNKTRTRFFRFLKDLGLHPLQKSVFWGELTRSEYQSLQREAHTELDTQTDKVFWINTKLNPEQLQNGVGYQDFFMVEADGFFTL